MAVPPDRARLPLKFHGRIIDHLGIEMYQSPVAAIAELVSNAWDADAKRVEITVPGTVAGNVVSEIRIRDNGSGMTFKDCEDRYLNIGYNTRGTNPTKTTPILGRPVLGRKGIGKFAGFGIAEVVRVETTSRENGERTVFEMDVREIRGNDATYVAGEYSVDVLEYEAPTQLRPGEEYGTTIVLRELRLGRGQNAEQFARSMARRFLLHSRTADFVVEVNGLPLPVSDDLEAIEFAFPRDYTDDQLPDGLVFRREGDDARAWGRESLEDGQVIEWRIVFHREPIGEKELEGVAVFANLKLAQAPFLFNLSGGLGGQHGVAYLSGRVEAAYLDGLPQDLISPERQRINWSHPETNALESWGQMRVRSLLRIWQERRNEGKVRALDERVGLLGARLHRLPASERKTVGKALRKLASMDALTQSRFEEVGNAILLSWEQGRLRELVDSLADADTLDEAGLLSILMESEVLIAIHTLEAVKAKVLVIERLEARVLQKELENSIRDYIAEYPWLISPNWELFAKERGLKPLLDEIREERRLDDAEGYAGRVDLVLRSGTTLLVIEFMRPGIRLDLNHLSRFEIYVESIRARLATAPDSELREVIGYVIADKIAQDAALHKMIRDRQANGMYAMDWTFFVTRAKNQWRHYFEVLIDRAPEDDRVSAIVGKDAVAVTVTD